MKGLVAWATKYFPKKDNFIIRFLRKIRDGVSGVFETLFNTSSWLLKLGFVIQTIMGLISLVFSVILLFKNFGTIKDLMLGVTDGSDKWLDKIVNLFSQYPTFSSLIADMDASMTSLSTSYFTPPVTFTSILQTFGIGDAFNTICTCALQGIAFVISVRILMWSLSRLKLTITRPLS